MTVDQNLVVSQLYGMAIQLLELLVSRHKEDSVRSHARGKNHPFDWDPMLQIASLFRHIVSLETLDGEIEGRGRRRRWQRGWERFSSRRPAAPSPPCTAVCHMLSILMGSQIWSFLTGSLRRTTYFTASPELLACCSLHSDRGPRRCTFFVPVSPGSHDSTSSSPDSPHPSLFSVLNSALLSIAIICVSILVFRETRFICPSNLD